MLLPILILTSLISLGIPIFLALSKLVGSVAKDDCVARATAVGFKIFL